MADLDDIHRTLLEVRDLMKQEMEEARAHAEASQANTQLALARQATAVRFQRLGIVVVVVMVGIMYWVLTNLTGG